MSHSYDHFTELAPGNALPVPTYSAVVPNSELAIPESEEFNIRNRTAETFSNCHHYDEDPNTGAPGAVLYQIFKTKPEIMGERQTPLLAEIVFQFHRPFSQHISRRLKHLLRQPEPPQEVEVDYRTRSSVTIHFPTKFPGRRANAGFRVPLKQFIEKKSSHRGSDKRWRFKGQHDTYDLRFVQKPNVGNLNEIWAVHANNFHLYDITICEDGSSSAGSLGRNVAFKTESESDLVDIAVISCIPFLAV